MAVLMRKVDLRGGRSLPAVLLKVQPFNHRLQISWQKNGLLRSESLEVGSNSMHPRGGEPLPPKP